MQELRSFSTFSCIIQMIENLLSKTVLNTFKYGNYIQYTEVPLCKTVHTNVLTV